MQNNDIEMYSLYNEGKYVVAERFIRTLEGKPVIAQRFIKTLKIKFMNT